MEHQQRQKIPCTGYDVYDWQKFSSSPIIINGIIYISSDVALYAIDSKNGKDKWYFETKGCNSGRFNGRPEISNNTLYVGNQNGNLYAIDINTGKEKWKYTTNGAIYSAPKIINGLVLFGSEDSYFYALDSETGKLQWRFLADGSIYSSPVIENSSVFFSGKNTLYSLNILNGNKNFTFNFTLTTSNGLYPRSPVIANGVIYISDVDFYLRAVNAYTGETIWKTKTYNSIPVILGNNGDVFVSGESGQK